MATLDELSIQSQHRIFEALAASERAYRLRLDNLREIVFETDEAGFLIYLNRAWHSLLQHEVPASLGKRLEDFALHEDRQILEVLNDPADGKIGEPAPFELRLLRLDGKPVWFEYTAMPNDIKGLVGSLRDISEHKQMEILLREKTRQLETILENAMVGIGFIENRILTYANSAFCDLLGYTQKEMLGQSTRMFMLSDEDYAYVGRELYPRWRDGETITFDLQLRHKDGRGIWLRNTSKLASDSQAEPRLVLIAQDIRDLKAAEEKNRQLLAILDETPDFVGFATPDGNLQYMNKGGYALLGRLVENDLSTLHIQDDHPTWAYRKIVEEGMPAAVKNGYWQGENALLHTDGHEIPVAQTILAHRDAAGKPSYFSTIMRDISEQKRMEAKLKASELRWKFALEGSGQGVWDWDIPSGEVYYSPLWKSMIGYGEEELPNRIEEWTSRLHPSDKPQVMAILEAYFLGHLPEFTVEFRMLHKDGSYRWIQGKGIVAERSGKGLPVRMIGIHIDIHGRKQAEQKLQECWRALNSDHPFALNFDQGWEAGWKASGCG